jgi:tripartite-type tricarboxylate transporter receptor subunit TctC
VRQTISYSGSIISIAACLAACLTMASATAVHAQGYPTKPVRIIVASSAGSNPDVFGRIVAAGLTQALGQQFLVENRAGAGGNIGAEVAARAPADGYTVFLMHTNHPINTALQPKLNYDLFTDFIPVTHLVSSAFVLVVHPSLPANSTKELIALARARPGAITYSSAGTGAGTHLAAELFTGMVKVKMLHVSYKGGGPALTAITSGETQVYFTPVSTGMPHIRASKLRPLGVTTTARLPDLPDVPAVAETVPGYEFISWAGFMLPAKSPKQVADILYKSAISTLKDPETGKRLHAAGFVSVGSTPEQFSAKIRSEIDKLAKLIRGIGLRPE